MKILIAHNYYQNRGGEDASYESEVRLLRDAGHRVVEYKQSNDEIQDYTFFEKVSLGWRASWSDHAHSDLRGILARESPNVAHFHNTFPLISPSAYYACHAAGVAVVQTLHNYRLVCPGGNLFRDGQVCEECVSGSLLRSVLYGCYRESRVETAAVAGMLTLHGHLQTWTKQVDLFLACTRFARRKFVTAGMDDARIRVKPNFIAPDPGVRKVEGNSALYIGRLSQEKGPQLLLSAWSHLAVSIPLKIVGDGPLLISLQSDASCLGLTNVCFKRWLDASEAIELLRAAKFLIVPSMCYEGFPRVVAEAYACGIPIIAAGIGGLAEIVQDGRTGLHFAPGDAEDLSAKVSWAWTHPREMEAMGRAARCEFETKYTAAAALKHLESAYEFVLGSFGRVAIDTVGPGQAELDPLAKPRISSD